MCLAAAVAGHQESAEGATERRLAANYANEHELKFDFAPFAFIRGQKLLSFAPSALRE
jgi:hypothetical protein